MKPTADKASVHSSLGFAALGVFLCLLTGCATQSLAPAIHAATANGQLDQVKSQIAKGVDINRNEGNSGTPLHQSVTAKRISHTSVQGPNGELIKVNWIPNGRVRLDFINCRAVSVTKVFPDPKSQTHIECSYLIPSATEQKI
jgi:ankyrin repeat protein